MCYLCHVFLLLFVTVTSSSNSFKSAIENDSLYNSLFSFQDIKHCGPNEYYNINYFTCSSCLQFGKDLHPAEDKFSCLCKPLTLTSVIVYDARKPHIKCEDRCNPQPSPSFAKELQIQANFCVNNTGVDSTQIMCKYKYINQTIRISATASNMESNKNIEMTYINWQYDGKCDECNLQYNFHYQDYCIANALLAPYLRLNSFWLNGLAYYAELKMVAFFCNSLHNQTACNQLANLCIISHHAFNKNSPCNTFLLSQAVEYGFRYSNMDEEIRGRMITPFLYHRKGTEALRMLNEPIKYLNYNTKRLVMNGRLELFTTIYDLDGHLKYWGSSRLIDLNLCSQFASLDVFQFSAPSSRHFKCFLTLEQLIDLAALYGNEKFISLYLNYSSIRKPKKRLLQALPILIHNLTAENNLNQMEHWLLVRRFLPIAFTPAVQYSTNMVNTPMLLYNNAYKLLQYRTLRYVEKFELHYEIYDQNEISVPLIKLQYRNIEIHNNITLDQLQPFEFLITYECKADDTQIDLYYLNDILLPILLMITAFVAICRVVVRNRQRLMNISIQNDDGLCEMRFLSEFLLELLSYLPVVLLIFLLIYISYQAIKFYTQIYVKLCLPLIKDANFLLTISYTALGLQVINASIKFWRLSQSQIFFIDWERPRYGNNGFNNINHLINLKSNFETSSVCSNMRNIAMDVNPSAWRSIFLANEWVRLSSKQKISIFLQGIIVYILFKIFDRETITYNDLDLKLFLICSCYILVYTLQYIYNVFIMQYIFDDGIQKYLEHCSLSNISIIILIEPTFGYYIHGRSPHGASDVDLISIVMQLQREAQCVSGRRGLLNDTDQCYTIMPPRQMFKYFQKLLLPLQRSLSSNANAVARDGSSNASVNSHLHYRRAACTIGSEALSESASVAYYNLNRFLCAFIDHSIKDLDYIIKEKSFLENLFDWEYDQYVNENKGTFCLDKGYAFAELFLYNNECRLCPLHLLLILTVYMQFQSLLTAIISFCIFNKILQLIYRRLVRENLSEKTLIDKRFLI